MSNAAIIPVAKPLFKLHNDLLTNSTSCWVKHHLITIIILSYSSLNHFARSFKIVIKKKITKKFMCVCVWHAENFLHDETIRVINIDYRTKKQLALRNSLQWNWLSQCFPTCGGSQVFCDPWKNIWIPEKLLTHHFLQCHSKNQKKSTVYWKFTLYLTVTNICSRLDNLSLKKKSMTSAIVFGFVHFA